MKKIRWITGIVLTIVLSLHKKETLKHEYHAYLIYLTEPIYCEMGSYSEGLRWVKGHEEDVSAFLDKRGNIEINLYDDEYQFRSERDVGDSDGDIRYNATDFKDGYAMINTSRIFDIETWNGFVINRQGDIVFRREDFNKKNKELGYQCAGCLTSPSEGVILLLSKEDDDVIVYSLDGSYEQYDVSSTYMRGPCEGLICLYRNDVKDRHKNFQYVNLKMEQAIPMDFDYGRPFSEGLAVVGVAGLEGVINKKGEYVIPPEYEYIGRYVPLDWPLFNYGWTAVQKDGKWGVIDKAGNVVIDIKYPRFLDIMDGYVLDYGEEGYDVENKECFFIDENGVMFPEHKFEDVNCFNKDGITFVKENGVYYMMDRNGKQVGEETWDFEALSIDPNNPEYVYYCYNHKKWGIARLK